MYIESLSSSLIPLILITIFLSIVFMPIVSNNNPAFTVPCFTATFRFTPLNVITFPLPSKLAISLVKGFHLLRSMSISLVNIPFAPSPIFIRSSALSIGSGASSVVCNFKFRSKANDNK